MFAKKSVEPPHVAKFAKGEMVSATFETSLGNFVCHLFADECPLTVGNFVALATGEAPWIDPSGAQVNKPFYDGTVFHRVIKSFMIQGGCPLGQGTGGPGYKFGDEFVATLKHNKPGILSMANAGPGTNGSQFFITEVPTPWLDGKHTVFGEVTEGMDIVLKIAHAPTGAQDRPRDNIVLQRVSISRKI